jgi:hypothetical protein
MSCPSTTYQVRVGDQLKAAKALGIEVPPTLLARCRRGDRISADFAALRSVANGTKRTFGDASRLSALEGKQTFYGPRYEIGCPFLAKRT